MTTRSPSGMAFAGAQPAYRLLTPALSRTRRCYQQPHGHAAARCARDNRGTAPDGRLVNRWISFRPGDTGYQQLTSGVTLAGLAGQLELTGPLTIKAPGMVAGQSAEGVHGTVPASAGAPAGSKATLYVAAGGRALPVSYRLDRTGSLQFAATFSRWGERLHLTAPSQAIPVTSISL